MLYNIWYREEYGRNYLIEADSEEQARELLEEGLMDGKFDGPDECIDSHMTITKE